ncbi:MAG: T9SS type A sorting domain-containing protein [Bacteroidota bacterium]|nr:T9SS type A sorting domain-containing protein [Bacteroidota bacterium]
MNHFAYCKFLIVLFLSFHSVIFPQLPNVVNHTLNNEFGDGSSGGKNRLSDSLNDLSAPYTLPLYSADTRAHAATTIDGQTIRYTGYTNSTYVYHTAIFHSIHNLTVRSIMLAFGDHNFEPVSYNYNGSNTSATAPFIIEVADGNVLLITFQNDFWYNDIHFYVAETNPMAVTLAYNDPRELAAIMTHRGIPEWPSTSPRNLTAQPDGISHPAHVKLTWTEHPNSYVTKYEIWRKCNTPNHPNETVKIGEVNRGTTSFIDHDFYYEYGGASTQKTTVQYDVRAYYATESTYSPENYVSVNLYYHYLDKKVADQTCAITDYSLSNYPNPFNPTTKIEYQVPNAGRVSIRVFNLLGKEVATLVNEYKEAGKYTAEFNASDLNSGLYICEMRAGTFTKINKMLFVK